MYFEIQINNPNINDCDGITSEEISSAICSIFPATTEDAILVWNWIPIRLNYNADLSVIIEDILTMIEELLASEQSSARVYFGSSTFQGEWLCRRTSEVLEISARWEVVAGSYEEILNKRAILKLSFQDFIAEWKSVLFKILLSLRKSKIRLSSVEQVERIEKIYSSIPLLGRLYRDRPLHNIVT
jgi:hypothetical protein